MKLSEYCNKKIKLTLEDDKVIEGKCLDFTKAIYNDPEIASIDIEMEGKLYEIYENEIKDIEILK